MEQMKKRIKQCLPKYLYFSKKTKSIGILGVRRGGTTLLTQILSDPKTRIIDQPLEYFDREKFNYAVKYKRANLPPKELCQYFKLTVEELDKIRCYLETFEKGKASFIDLNFGLFKNRILYKFVNGGYVFEEITEKIQPILIFRHPLTQGLSCIRNNWSNYYGPYLDSLYFRKTFLNDKKIKVIGEIEKNGSALERAFVDWYCSNANLLKVYKNYPYVFYEDLVLNPKTTSDYLERKFAISPDKKKFDRPSGSSFLSTVEFKNNIQNETYKLKHLSKPFDSISNSEKEVLQMLLNIFEINMYSMYSPIPIKT